MAVISPLLLNMLLAICPKLPYENSFNSEIRPGFQITIMGHSNENYREGLLSPTKKGFIINLNGENIYDGLKVLHVNPRFDENSTMVLNTKSNSTWGPEERHLNHEMAGPKDFVFVIQAHENEFKLFVNGRHFADYKYRQPLNLVTGISIKGLVTVHQVIAKQYDLLTLPVPAKYVPSDVVVQNGYPIILENSSIPLSVPVASASPQGMVVAIEGTPLEGARFYVDWATDNNEVALHLNPRFSGNPVFVMNTYFNSNWGMEDNIYEFPFEMNKKFYLFVKTHLTHYELWLNGEHYEDYKHRQIPPQNVTKIEVNEKNGVHIDKLVITY